MPQLAEVQAPHSPGRPRRSPVDPEAFLDLTLMRGPHMNAGVPCTEGLLGGQADSAYGAGRHVVGFGKVGVVGQSGISWGDI